MLREPLVIAVAQPLCVPYDVAVNAVTHAATVRSAGARVVGARRVATDHHVWVAVASFAGSTGGGFTQAAGRSSIWTSNGVVVTQAGPETGAIAHATLH